MADYQHVIWEIQTLEHILLWFREDTECKCIRGPIIMHVNIKYAQGVTQNSQLSETECLVIFEQQ